MHGFCHVGPEQASQQRCACPGWRAIPLLGGWVDTAGHPPAGWMVLCATAAWGLVACFGSGVVPGLVPPLIALPLSFRISVTWWRSLALLLGCACEVGLGRRLGCLFVPLFFFFFFLFFW